MLVLCRLVTVFATQDGEGWAGAAGSCEVAPAECSGSFTQDQAVFMQTKLANVAEMDPGAPDLEGAKVWHSDFWQGLHLMTSSACE